LRTEDWGFVCGVDGLNPYPIRCLKDVAFG